MAAAACGRAGSWPQRLDPQAAHAAAPSCGQEAGGTKRSFSPCAVEVQARRRGGDVIRRSYAGATELHPVTTRLEGCYSCRPCGDLSAQEKVLGRDEVGSGQVKICKCEEGVPNHNPEELSAQAKSGRASEKPGVLRSAPSVPVF